MDDVQNPAPASPSPPKTDKLAAEARVAQAQQMLHFARIVVLEEKLVLGGLAFFEGLLDTNHLGETSDAGRKAFIDAAKELAPLLSLTAAGMKAQAEQLMVDANV